MGSTTFSITPAGGAQANDAEDMINGDNQQTSITFPVAFSKYKRAALVVAQDPALLDKIEGYNAEPAAASVLTHSSIVKAVPVEKS